MMLVLKHKEVSVSGVDKETQDIIQRILSKFVDGKCSRCGKKIKYILDGSQPVCEDCKKKEEEQKRRLARIDYIIPLGYREMSFESFDLKNRNVKNLDKAFAAAQRFVIDNAGVYLWGCAGQGKTHLLIAALRECILQGKYVKLLRYSTELKNYKEQGLRKEDFFKEYSTCDYLFIDDFGSVGTKDDAIDILYGILQRRIENKKGKKIFITANMPIAQIGDDRVKSRIVGMCIDYKCHDSSDTDTEKYSNIIELQGDDIRLTGRI
jgi:DNA replication protein DnaC